MERVDSLKRKFESQKLENESNKMRKLPSLLNIETRPNVKNETHKHQMFIRHVSGISFGPFILGAKVKLRAGARGWASHLFRGPVQNLSNILKL